MAGGAEVQGIMPAFLQALEPPVSPEEKLIVTPHMQERKTLMLQMSDAFIVLPGGLGTFDEFFEVATEAQLGVHDKPIIVVNVDGYFDALDAMLHAMVEAGFAKDTILTLYQLAGSAGTALWPWNRPCTIPNTPLTSRNALSPPWRRPPKCASAPWTAGAVLAPCWWCCSTWTSPRICTI